MIFGGAQGLCIWGFGEVPGVETEIRSAVLGIGDYFRGPKNSEIFTKKHSKQLCIWGIEMAPGVESKIRSADLRIGD